MSQSSPSFPEMLPDEKTSGVSGIIEWFVPATCRADREAHRRARILVTSALVLGPVSLFMSTVFVLQGTLAPLGALGFGVGALLAVSTPFLLRYTGRRRLLSNVLLAEILLVFSFQAFIDAGIRDPSALALVVLPWLAALLLGPTGGLYWSGIVAADLLAFYVMHQFGMAAPDPSPEAAHWWFQLVGGVAAAVLVGCMGRIYERTRSRLRQTLRQEREAARRRIAASEARAARLEESRDALAAHPLPFMVLTSLTEGRVCQSSRSAQRLLRQGAGEKRDGVWHLSPQVASALQEAADGGDGPPGAEEGSVSELFIESMRKWFAASFRPVGNRVALCLADVSEAQHRMERLAKRREEAERRARQRQERLQRMSRSVRQRVMHLAGMHTAVAGTAQTETPASTEAPEVGTGCAQVVQEETQGLLRVLDSVHELGRLEEGVQVARRRVNLQDLLGDVLESLPEDAAEAPACSVWNEPPAFVPEVEADPRHLYRALTRLFRRAVRLCGSSGLTVEMKREAAPHGAEGDVHLTVSGSTNAPARSAPSDEEPATATHRNAFEEEAFDLEVAARLVEVAGGTLSDVESDGGGFCVAFRRRPKPAGRVCESAGRDPSGLVAS